MVLGSKPADGGGGVTCKHVLSHQSGSNFFGALPFAFHSDCYNTD